MKLADVTRHTVRSGIKGLEEYRVRRKDGEGNAYTVTKTRAPATLSRYKSALSAVFEIGKEKFDLHENPCRQVKTERKIIAVSVSCLILNASLFSMCAGFQTGLCCICWC